MEKVLLKIATSASAIAMATILSATPIFAAEALYVSDKDGNTVYDDYWSGDYTSEDGTWSWTNQGLDLTLNGYNGGVIGAYGDLNINLTGENTITSEYDNAIYIAGHYDEENDGYIDGDLTITSNNGGKLTAYSGDGCSAIYVDRDVTIKDVEMTLDTETYEGYNGISAYGDVSIENSNITIKTAKNYSLEDDMWVETGIRGVNITIANSNVDIDANVAMEALADEPGEENAASITLKNCKIVLPDGAYITTWLNDTEGGVYYNQIIATSSETLTNDNVTDYAVGKVTIKKTGTSNIVNRNGKATVDTGVGASIGGNVIAMAVAAVGLVFLKKRS